jgi:hypothetical protein
MMNNRILEISQHGDLQIPSELLPQGKLYRRYHLEIDGETLILRPQKSDSFWATATPAQRAVRFRQWAAEAKRPIAPPLPDEALSRETIYD